MIEYMTVLPSNIREKIIEICYDDACHFKKFSEDEKRSEINNVTKFMAGIGKHVDKFHFPNHVDAWCHENCNPQDVKHLDGVNTPICEQLFSAINKFTNAKAMNEAHFFLFFLYVFDLHNLNIEGKLRCVANPKSSFRSTHIETMIQNTIDAQEENDEINDVTTMIENMTCEEVASVGSPKSEFKCEVCGVGYKRIANLRQHIRSKHEDSQNTAVDLNYCKVCGKSFVASLDLKAHL